MNDLERIIADMRHEAAHSEPKDADALNAWADRLAALAGAAPVAWMSQGGDVSRSAEYFREMGFREPYTPLFPHAPAKAREDWQVPVYFAGADSMGGTTYFATYDELHACMTTGEGSKRYRCYVWAGRLDVTPANLVDALNGSIEGSVDYDALATFAEGAE